MRIFAKLTIHFSLAFSLAISPICSVKIKGEFAWSARDNRGVHPSERKLFIESKYHISRENLYFYDYETIWWIYRITHGLYFEDKFFTVLYEDNHTPHPVILDLRKASIGEGDGFDYIRYYYENLIAGQYLLQIAYNSKVIDQIQFFIFPSGGPTKLTGPMPERVKERIGETIEEIPFYSRSVFSRKYFE